MEDAGFFSALGDGSQPTKTGKEKELVYIRCVRNGVATYFMVALEDISDYGDATADNVKKAMENSFINKLKISKERYEIRLFSLM